MQTSFLGKIHSNVNECQFSRYFKLKESFQIVFIMKKKNFCNLKIDKGKISKQLIFTRFYPQIIYKFFFSIVGSLLQKKKW